MLTKFILIFVSVFIGIVTFDSCQGQRDAPRYFHNTNTTIKHPTTHDVRTKTHHTATTTAAAAAKTTARHYHVTSTPRYYTTPRTALHTVHPTRKTTHHTATTTAAAAAKTTARHYHVTSTPSHTTKAVQKKCLKKMKPNDLMNLIFGLIPRIKTIEFAENENLQKLAELFEELFKH
ncbi:unnamed protein product [Schistosoma haematobium]|nr:unnamed protein product [Schistosoma haematobium]CAH8637210.1 unnamed protein product [Schistosoma haematobium]CAH8637225.1 unnamed protein product [Schistosoma haematobium]